MEKQQSPKFLRQRKLLTVLPVLAFPFLTLMFWALGGGRVNSAIAGEKIDPGFNIELPGANNKAEPFDKMAYYEEAQKDSAKLLKLMKSDPYYDSRAQENLSAVAQTDYAEDDSPYESSSYGYSRAAPDYGLSDPQDPNEKKVYEKIHLLQAALDKADEADSDVPVTVASGQAQGSLMGGDLDRLEQMMQTMQGGKEEDPELIQLHSMLESILDIQHPERVQQKLQETSREHKGQVYAVSATPAADLISVLDAQQPEARFASTSGSEQHGFFSLDDNLPGVFGENLAIGAVVHETQTYVNGSTVKLRLIADVYINGVLIPKDQFIYGTAALNGDRLTVHIESLRYGNSLFPVALSVYDMDGMPGISIPGAISRDVAKQSGDQALQGLGMTSLDPSLGAQAASAGIELTKNLLSKKIKLVKVQVKAGYQVLLKDEKQKQNN